MAKIRKRIRQRPGQEALETWVADYTDQNGRRHNKTFGKKKEAEAWLARTKVEVADGVHTPASDSITIAEMGTLWLAKARAEGLEASTLMQYRQHLDLHLTPYVGRIKLAEFRLAHLQKLRERLIADGRSRGMVRRVIVSLGAILAEAVNQGRLARSIIRDQPRARERRVAERHDKHLVIGTDIPTKSEINLMLEHATGRWRPLLVTAVFTGLRASELRGLRWEDVDLERRTLTVRQRADRWNTIGSPKSKAGKRTVSLASLVVNVLREWSIACPKAEAGLVFPNGAGKVETLSNIYRRGLGAVQKAAGLCADENHPKYGLHALRHAAASLLIEEGWSPKRIQEFMGHGSMQMTFDTYGHLFPNPEGDTASLDRMQARLVG